MSRVRRRLAAGGGSLERTRLCFRSFPGSRVKYREFVVCRPNRRLTRPEKRRISGVRRVNSLVDRTGIFSCHSGNSTKHSRWIRESDAACRGAEGSRRSPTTRLKRPAGGRPRPRLGLPDDHHRAADDRVNVLLVLGEPLQEQQQRIDLERSFEYAKKKLGVGVKWRA